MKYQALYRKYRPKTFDDVYGQQIVVQTLKNVIKNNKLTHAYLFDEIITNMPVRGRKSKEETDTFYGRFFEKSAGLLKADGILVLYSNEQGFIRKQLRIRSAYRLLAEQCIREKDQFYLFVIQYKG